MIKVRKRIVWDDVLDRLAVNYQYKKGRFSFWRDVKDYMVVGGTYDYIYCPKIGSSGDMSCDKLAAMLEKAMEWKYD